MHAFYSIYCLCDMQIDSGARQHIRVFPRQAAFGRQLVNQFRGCAARGFVQAFI